MNEGEEIRSIDLFSGIGGFRLGLERTNDSSNQPKKRTDNHEENECHSLKIPKFRCVWSCDNNKYANQVYTKQFGKEGHYSGNIRGVNPQDIPDFDLLCAGFPCQTFSVAGKRKGFKDTRGTLFFEILRVAEAKRPHLLFLENVKGLLNHDGGRTFTVILQSLDELGYWVEWQVLNSKYFGVPQNRERVFIIGHLRGAGGREVFPIAENDEYNNEGNRAEARGQVGVTLSARSAGGQNARGNYVLTERDEATARDENGNPQLLPIGYRRIRRLTPIECERLQGFPDGWTEGISDTQRYKCLGNAVTVNVIEFLGKLIRESVI